MTQDRFASKAHDWHMNPQIVAMFWAFVEKFRATVPLSPSLDLLDVGGGTGLITFELAPSVRSVTIVDSSPAMCAVARERIAAEGLQHCQVLEGDLLETPTGSELFDRIYAHMSMHHIENTAGAIQRCFELLRPEGILVIADLLTEDGSLHGDEGVPHNGFDVAALQKLVEKVGFVDAQADALPPMERGTDPVRLYERFFLSAKKR